MWSPLRRPLTRQAGRPPGETLAEWRDAVARTVALLSGIDDLDRTIALHGLRLPLGDLMLVRAFELWVHENDIQAGGRAASLGTRPVGPLP